MTYRLEEPLEVPLCYFSCQFCSAFRQQVLGKYMCHFQCGLSKLTAYMSRLDARDSKLGGGGHWGAKPDHEEDQKLDRGDWRHWTHVTHATHISSASAFAYPRHEI